MCEDSNVVCMNGGIRDPNDCTSCMCPEPFDGATCSDLKGGVEGKRGTIFPGIIHGFCIVLYNFSAVI